MKKQRKIGIWFCAILLLFTISVAGVMSSVVAYAEPTDGETTNQATPGDSAKPATAANYNAAIEMAGPLTWDTEDIQREITVTLDDQIAEYKINVHMLRATELFIDDALYTVADTLDISELPAGFEEVKTAFGDGETITVAKSPDGSLLLTQFVSEQNHKLWYRVDMKERTFSPVQLTKKDGKVFVKVISDINLLYGNGAEENGYYAYDTQTGKLEFSVNPTGTVELKPP